MTEQNQTTEDPTPTDPSSTDPISADPTPTDQFSTDPVSPEPTPAEPVSTEPTPTDQEPTEPTSSDQDSNGSSTGKTIGIILLALVGVVVVLVLGYFLAQAISGDSNTADAGDPTVVAPTPAPNTPYLVAKTHVNVRSGPGTHYPVYGVSTPGQSAEVTGVNPDYTWWVIRIPTSVAPDGQGWITAYSVKIEPPDAPLPVIQPK